MPPALSSEFKSLRQRMMLWAHENLPALGWMAAWLFGCLLFVFAMALWLASKNRSTVVLFNEQTTAIHDVTLRPAAASSREPKHFLPHLDVHGEETFVLYPLSPCAIVLTYLDDQGNPHHWTGGQVAPKASTVRVHLRANEVVVY